MLKFIHHHATGSGLLAMLLLSGCGVTEPRTGTAGTRGSAYQQWTHEAFIKREDYPKTSLHWKDEELLAETGPHNAHVRVNLKLQRAYLMNKDKVVIDYPICSGTRSRPTPRGEFKILEKKVDKSSNRYGKIYNAAGECVNTDADALKDPIPPGGRFEGAEMPYWMRLTNDGVGHHVGAVLRQPASHACVRGPTNIIPLVFERLNKGSKIVIE